MAPDVLFTAEQIQERVRAMARLIASAPLVPNVAMPVLVGGFVFAADLIRALVWEGVAMMKLTKTGHMILRLLVSFE